MVFSTSRGSLLGVLSLVLRSTLCLDTATVSITAAVDYAIEPACVQSCVYHTIGGGNPAFLLTDLGCSSTVYNACYCTQLADQKASTALSSCVDYLCTGKTEISNAISLYQSYCVGAGYPRSVAAAQTTSASSSATTVSSTASRPFFFTDTPTPTGSSAPTPTSSSSVIILSTSPSSPNPNPPPAGASSSTLAPTSSNTSTSPKPKLVPIIGGAVGGVAVLALLSAILFLLLRRNRQASSPKPEAPTSVSMQSLVRPKVELENNGLRPAEHAVLAPPKPFAGVNRGMGVEHRELDSGGRYVGELYGGGRPVHGVELPENNGWKV